MSEIEKLDYDIAMFSQVHPFGPPSEVAEIREYLQDLRGEVFRMMEQGVNPMSIPSTIELPKYQDWPAYDQWFELNTWRVVLEFWIGW